jgi:hypothetical protein
VVGSRLLNFHGPVPTISTPGFPIVVLCASWNFFSKIQVQFVE